MGVVSLTTQNASIIAIAAVGLLMLAPSRMHYTLLCAACLGFAALVVALPRVAAGLVVTDNNDVFSLGLFGVHINEAWPDGWKWIADNKIFPSGVGSAASATPTAFRPRTSSTRPIICLCFYANFGLPGVLYLASAGCQGLRLPGKIRPLRSVRWPSLPSISPMEPPWPC